MAFFDELKQGLTEVGKTVYEKSEQFISIQKLKVKKNSLKSELKDTYAEIGKMIYEEKKAGMEFSGPVVQLCQKIDLGLEAIAEVDAQIEAAKEQEEQNEDSKFTDDAPYEGEVVMDDAVQQAAEPADGEAISSEPEEPVKEEEAPAAEEGHGAEKVPEAEDDLGK